MEDLNCVGCFKGALMRQVNLIETREKAMEYAAEHQKDIQIVEEGNNRFGFYEEDDPAAGGKEIVDRISKYTRMSAVHLH